MFSHCQIQKSISCFQIKKDDPVKFLLLYGLIQNVHMVA